jgi:hypothetical protein
MPNELLEGLFIGLSFSVIGAFITIQLIDITESIHNTLTKRDLK